MGLVGHVPALGQMPEPRMLEGQTLGMLLKTEGEGWQPLLALVNGANYLALTPFLEGAQRAVGLRLAQLVSSDQIEARLGTEPDVPAELLHTWVAGLDQQTLRNAARISSYWGSVAEPLIVPYHTVTVHKRERGPSVSVRKRLSTFCNSLVARRRVTAV